MKFALGPGRRDATVLLSITSQDGQLVRRLDLQPRPKRSVASKVLLMARAAFRQRDVTRLIKGAVAAGLPVGSFSIQLVDGRPTLIPVQATLHGGMGREKPLDSGDLDTELQAWRAKHGED